MQTSDQWWDSIKTDKSKINEWLQRQYAGEKFAADRINELVETTPEKHKATMREIARQEYQHAEWINEYLVSNNIEQLDHDTVQRYWKETCPDMHAVDFQTLTAIATHAETMRLERISVIANDDSSDLQTIFKNILVDEVWHAKAFNAMTTVDHLDQTRYNHDKGMNALGLTI